MIMTGAGADQARREADVALRDGTTVHVRPARHEDAPELQRLFEGLSGESRYLRFFSGAVDVPLVVHWAADVDYQQRDGLVALTGADGRIVAHVGWERERDRPERAEIALVIDDGFQGRGLGTIMLGQLAESARVQGVELFIAEVLPGNHRMLRVFRDSGFSVRTRSLPGVIMAEMPTELTPDALRRFEDREERASAAAMRRVLAPRSVAVIGASRRRGTVGGELFHNLLAAGFAGPVYPVNPKARSTSRSSPSRRRRWSRLPARARPRASVPWWCCRPVSPRAGPRASNASGTSWRSAGRPACGWSGRTASG